MSRVVLRRGVEIEDPLEVALAFLTAYSIEESPTMSFDESDLRHANRGGARISAVQIATILERRGAIERELCRIEPDASLATSAVPWAPLERLFDAFADIHGVGFSKMTKALHPKRPGLIPMLDSVVQAHLAADDPGTGFSFGERAIALVRGYKGDLDRNRSALRALQAELASRGYRLTEVRILDILIWSLSA
jgi:hypothetical protein